MLNIVKPRGPGNFSSGASTAFQWVYSTYCPYPYEIHARRSFQQPDCTSFFVQFHANRLDSRMLRCRFMGVEMRGESTQYSLVLLRRVKDFPDGASSKLSKGS
uniref:Uncharacterized protein n=1 Tax=Compsopogon caeruleus TaxID=31354 RepID=A0A7S1TCP3_9RHOD|mmetsp:Transcript_17897/g.37163  ORF Transcript_17897/g.37163 Transcript_17897/m.37163 type:complete len:103 (+) Transcript_17897:86-394(+)